MSTFADLVAAELRQAREKFGPIHNLHEGYAVLLEEIDEVWDEVKKGPTQRDARTILKELVQVAAMAQRMAEDVPLTGAWL